MYIGYKGFITASSYKRITEQIRVYNDNHKSSVIKIQKNSRWQRSPWVIKSWAGRWSGSLLLKHLVLRVARKFFNPILGIWTYKPGLLEQPNEYHQKPGGNGWVNSENMRNNEFNSDIINMEEISYDTHEYSVHWLLSCWTVTDCDEPILKGSRTCPGLRFMGCPVIDTDTAARQGYIGWDNIPGPSVTSRLQFNE